jgi:hypothetical protein
MSLREFTTAPPRARVGDESPAAVPAAAAAVFDPLRYCIFTTLGIIAWIAGPAVVVAAASALGVAAYWRAWRAGLARSKCVLGDTRLVMLYLAVAFVASIVSIGVHIGGAWFR